MRVFKMTQAEYLESRDEDAGRCIACRAEAFGVEPDAREYTCEECGSPSVYGTEELLQMGLIELQDKGKPSQQIPLPQR